MSRFLAFDGGATTTRAALYALDGTLLAEAVGNACNPVEYGLPACVSTLVSLAGQLTGEMISGVAASISGAKEPSLRDEIAKSLCVKIRAERTVVTDDLRPILYANAGSADALLVIAGTGSSVLAQAADGRSVVVGGRGRLLGDEGSAYHIAAAALRAAAHAVDGLGRETRLVTVLPSAAGVNTFAELVPWSASASKQQVAALTPTVDALAAEGDAAARECIMEQAGRLAAQAAAAKRRLALPQTTRCYLHGGVFRNSFLFLEAFKRALAGHWPDVEPRFPGLVGHGAVLALAMAPEQLPEWVCVCRRGDIEEWTLLDTEQPVPGVLSLDRMSPLRIVQVMNQEDKRIPDVIVRRAPEIAQVIEAVAQSFASGGRLIYIGAGTSGRLGVLDASECPPTFGVPPEKVVGIIAGGPRALRESIEGAEDDTDQAAKDLDTLGPPVCPRDIVIGIAASGRTPYTLAALRCARARGAITVLLSCNSKEESPAALTIALETGGEVLPGSTRLKAGTATKMVLNMISTGALALSGYVYEGRMVGVRPTNKKLQERAARIVRELAGVDRPEAERLLQAGNGSIPVAVIMARKSVDAATAKSLLDKAGGKLREALDEN